MVKKNLSALYLTIIAWNIYIGTGKAAAREALRGLISRFNPEVFALMEATNLYGDLEGLGYEVVQLRPRSLRRGNRPGQANIALLVRKDLEIKKRRALRMTTFWRGPKHGLPQDPRVYRWIKIRIPGRWLWKRYWKIAAAHTPFGQEARRESNTRLRRWLRDTVPGRPTILVLDANMKLAEFEKKISDPADAEATAFNIEVAAWKHCELEHSERGTREPSDHPWVRYEFSAERQRKKVT